MANEITRRLPSSQARLTDTYVPSNLPAPLAPQALPQIPQPYLGSNNVGNALQNLINPLLNFGNEVIEADRIQVATEEQLRVSKMAIEEVRAELMGQARDAEGAGLLAPGANPYRKVVAQEYLAERVMRDQFEKAISAETARFSNPLSNEDPAPFAREKYGELTEGMGYFAQRRAVDLYDSMTKNWLSQVQNTKSARLVSLNEEQLYDNAYNAFRTYQEEVDDPNITADQAYENLITTVEYWDQKYMQAVGPGGREHSVKALAAYINTGVQQATDEADLDELTNLITKIEEETEGPLAFNMEQRAEVDAIRTLIHKKSESFGDVSAADHQEDVDAGKREIYLILDEREQVDPNAPAGPPRPLEEEVRERLSGLDLSPSAIAEVMQADLPDILERRTALADRGEKRDAGDQLSDALDLYDRTGDIELVEAYIRTLDLPGELEVSMMGVLNSRDRTSSTRENEWRNIAHNQLAVLGAYAAKIEDAVYSQTDNPLLAAELTQLIIQDVQNKAREAHLNAGSTDEQVQKAVTDRIAEIGKVVSVSTEETKFDLDAVDQLGIDGLMERATTVNQELAATRLNIPVPAPGQPLPPPDLGADIEAIRESIDAGNFDAARTRGDEDRKERLSHIKAISEGEPYGTWNIVTGTKAEIKEDGVYISRYPKSRFVPAILLERDSSQTGRYVLDKRLSGLTVQELSSGMTAEGMRLDVSPDFLNPSKTVMLDPEKFDTHLQELIDANKDKLSSDAIIRGTAFGEVYSAYVEAVGVGNEMSFEDFITTQMATVMQAVHPVTPQQIKALEDSSQ